MVTDRNIYFFDLRGFLVLRQALGPASAINKGDPVGDDPSDETVR
jgi:hypothetical protein